MFSTQIQNDPAYSLPFLYIQGLNVSIPAATSPLLVIAAGQARDQNDFIDMPVGSPNYQGLTTPAPLVLNSALTGANGLDQGVIAINSIYSVWLIGDSRGYNPVAGLISLASNAEPLLPKGYDSMRLLASVTTNGAGLFQQAGVGIPGVLLYSQATVFYTIPNVLVLAAAAGNVIFNTVSLAPTIPAVPLNGIVFLVVNYTPAGAGDTVQFRYLGSAATTNLVTVTGQSAGVTQQNIVPVVYNVVAGVPSIQYKCSNATDGLSLFIYGYALPMIQP